MIFIGIGFLMTFLKKYGLSAVSLNMLIAVVCLQWGLLVYGWTHLHCGKIYFNLSRLKIKILISNFKNKLRFIFIFCFEKPLSMLGADFCAATVLISFGVLLGKTSPLQVIVMALIEIVLFIGNEIIGRKYFGVSIFFTIFNIRYNVCSKTSIILIFLAPLKLTKKHFEVKNLVTVIKTFGKNCH